MHDEIIRRLQNRPFRPFAIVTDSGQQVIVRHPENVAYDPASPPANCYALADGVMHIIPWTKVSNVAVVDRDEPLPVELLDFPEVFSQGRTLDEARAMIRDVLKLVAECRLEGGKPLPSPNPAARSPKAIFSERISWNPV